MVWSVFASVILTRLERRHGVYVPGPGPSVPCNSLFPTMSFFLASHDLGWLSRFSPTSIGPEVAKGKSVKKEEGGRQGCKQKPLDRQGVWGSSVSKAPKSLVLIQVRSSS